MRNRSMMLITFGSVYGLPPWSCHFCDDEVQDYKVGIVHHKNHDESDDTPSNLVPAHRGCHSSHHNSGQNHPQFGVVRSEEARRKQSESTKGRIGSLGTANGNSKLVEEDIPVIRAIRSLGFLQREIADMFDVNGRTISQILIGKNWTHVKGTS